MPLYEYACRSCGHRFEVIQKIADAPLTSCVKCAGEVERLLSSPAIQFKGSGWYVTDYARKGSAAPEKSEKGEKAEKSSEGESKAESSGSDKKGESERPHEKAGKSDKAPTATSGSSKD